jgi:flagellum-specific ATP synthase
MLDRRLAVQNHYPAISVLDSLSRLMSAVAPPTVVAKARQIRRLLAAYAASEDLLRVGAYQKGLDAVLDQAVQAMPAITSYLQQEVAATPPLEQSFAEVLKLPG